MNTPISEDRESHMLRVTAPHMMGVLIVSIVGRVVRASPCLVYFLEWKEQRVMDYCQRKEWKVERI